MHKRLTPFIFLLVGFLSAYIVLTKTTLGVQTLGAKSFDRQQLPNGAFYQGTFDEEGLFTGNGLLTWENGDVYEGGFLQGLMHGKGTLRFSSGDIYLGGFIKGEMHGVGQWAFENGDIYTGDIAKDGLFHGQGVLISASGESYSGEFKKNLFHGQGVFTNSDKKSYSGEFIKGEFTGAGTTTSEDEGSLVGQFKNWQAHGLGFRTDKKGNQWRGAFEDGQLNGKGEFIAITGEYYKGMFAFNRFHGEGRLTDRQGNTYQGDFKFGFKHGTGEFEYANALDGIKKFRGVWRRDELIQGDDQVEIFSAERIAEKAMFEQNSLLQGSFEKLARDDGEAPQLFMLGIAGWGKEEVFRREINFIETQLNELFDSQHRSIFLVNSQRSIDQRPLATLHSIEKSLQALANVMDKEKDILMIYATSHGDKKSGFALAHKGIALHSLTPDRLTELLDESGIKHRLIIISACYSGVFIEPLQSEYTMVLTAASKDKTSFGCSDESSFTYFGKAFFKKSLEKHKSFSATFEEAKNLIAAWESEQKMTPSEPQISEGSMIKLQLKKWRDALQEKDL